MAENKKTILPKKKPNRVYMTDDNSGVIYSDKKGNVISKEQAMKGFDDADAAERREERRSSQYKKMKRGGMATQQRAQYMTAKEMMNDSKFSDKDRADESKTKIKYKANLRDLVKTDYKKMATGGMPEDNSEFSRGRKKLSGGQKKLDVNNDGKISGEDFKILKGKNNKMKGGGIAIKGTNFKGVF